MEETTTAVVEQQPSEFDIVKSVSGDNPVIGLVLVVVLVVGGKAGWSFWNKLLEKKHEQKMKELEIQKEQVECKKRGKGKK